MSERGFDAYRVLGISDSASMDAIKIAFRKRAKECHPDKGGREADMIAVLRAWAILSSVDSRAAYDRGRVRPTDLIAVAAKEKAEAAATAEVTKYPRAWPEFERWLNAIITDVDAAKYGAKIIPRILIPMPTTEGSNSAGVSMMTCGILFFIFCQVMPYWARLVESITTKPRFSFQLQYLIPPLLGGWIGLAMHKVIPDAIRSSTPQGERRRAKSVDPNATVIVQCPKCGKRLRVPQFPTTTIVVKCLRCLARWDYTATK